MKLLTKTQRAQLVANGRDHDRDHRPVVKFFDPSGAATWLFTELDPEDGDTLFGLADLGFGSPELGYSSLADMASVRCCLGLGIERDLYFKANHSLSVYAEAARAAGRIVEIGPELEEIVNRCDSIADCPRRSALGQQQFYMLEANLKHVVCEVKAGEFEQFKLYQPSQTPARDGRRAGSYDTRLVVRTTTVS